MTDPMMLSTFCPPDSAESFPLLQCAGRLLCEVKPDSALASAVIEFIQRRFLQAYGAQPDMRIPRLLALTTARGSLLAAVGVRNAGRERLFLEDYIDRPVERLIPATFDSGRDEIVEIAHLAGVEAGISRFLFPALAVWLQAQGYQWIAFTGTDQIRNSFRRLGITALVLGPADPEHLPDRGRGWGRYYEHKPKVMLASVAEGHDVLTRAGLLRRIVRLGGISDREDAYGRTA